MAYTKMASKIKVTLKNALDYIQDPNKTDELAYVYGGNCTPQFAVSEFELTKRDLNFRGKILRIISFRASLRMKPLPNRRTR